MQLVTTFSAPGSYLLRLLCSTFAALLRLVALGIYSGSSSEKSESFFLLLFRVEEILGGGLPLD